MKHLTQKLSRLILLCSLLIGSTHVFAFELSEQVITSWIASQSALEEWGKTHQSKLDAATPSAEMESPMNMTTESMIAPLKAAGLYESANQVVRDFGFKNADQWATATLRITKAAAAIEFESHPEMMDNSQLEALKNSKDINPEHKKILTEAIEQNQIMVKQIVDNANKADIEAVKPHLNRILKMMEEPY